MALRFDHEFEVPVPIERAWPVLLDVTRVAPCLPGATLDSVDGDSFTGRLRVKVGPITLTYRGSASFQAADAQAHTLTLTASGRETRGAGTASADVTARLFPQGERTRVAVETSVNVTGRPAQFGRGVLADVGGRIIDRFAANLTALVEAEREPDTPGSPDGGTPAGDGTVTRGGGALASEANGGIGARAGAPAIDGAAAHNGQAATPAEPAGTQPARPTRAYRTVEEQELDLLEIVGVPLARRMAVPAVALAALVAVTLLVRRVARRRAGRS